MVVHTVQTLVDRAPVHYVDVVVHTVQTLVMYQYTNVDVMVYTVQILVVVRGDFETVSTSEGGGANNNCAGVMSGPWNFRLSPPRRR